VLRYQTALDSVLESHPQLQPCVAHCAHCGIRFLTHPRNAGRIDLRCPFGCRRRHCRRCSSQRSAAYYRTPGGKLKKRRLNARRTAAALPPQPSSQPPSVPPENLRPAAAPPEPLFEARLRLDGVVLDEPGLLASPMLPYLRMAVSLVEGVPLSLAELVSLLRRALRQHSIARRRRTDYVLHVLHWRPP
jgi:hypothetical protein